MLESAYPYNGEGATCPSSWPAALHAPLNKAQPFNCLSTPGGAPANEKTMGNYVSINGPVAIALDATPLQSYTGGILVPDNQTVSCAEYALDHVVTVVGFNDNGTPPYWIVRNSWGNTWGEAGYFRIAKGVGACGMTQAVISVNLKGTPHPKKTCPSA
jgi:C1A family cysteine protease